MGNSLTMPYYVLLLQLVAIPIFSPLVIGFIRKVKAIFQNRQGAPVWQPYLNLAKLFHKDEVISSEASWIFRVAPVIIFGTTLLLGAAIPIISTQAAVPLLSDFLVVVYIVALNVFFLALAGLDVGSGFGGLGSSREMTLAALNEGGLLFSLLAVVLVAHTTSLSGVMTVLSTASVGALMPVSLAFIAFFVALLAENARYPFDNPATHLELTMVHEAMILEYSGKRLALIEWAAANKLLVFIVMGANLFVPWGSVYPPVSWSGLLLNLLLVVAKVLIGAFAIGVIESSMAKLRFFRLPDLLFTSFFLAAIAVVMVTM